MRKLTIDLGIEEFELDNGKILRFNPADLNLFDRFCASQDEILAVEREMTEKAEALGEKPSGEMFLRLMADADAKMKKILNRVFGGNNDFEDIFDGVNLMSVGTNGERVITNFIAAITPILEEGARRAANDEAVEAAAQIKAGQLQHGAKA